MRALERAAMTPPPPPLSSADDASRVYSREQETRVSAAASSEGRTAGSLSRGVVDVSDHEHDANLSRSARSARSAIEVRRVVDVSPRRDGGKPAPTETGAFIDFYSGVLGVDRAQLTLKR